MSLFLNIFKSFRTKRPEKRGRESASRCAVALVSFLCVLALAFSLVPPVFADEDPVVINEIQEKKQASEDEDTFSQKIDSTLEILTQQLLKLVQLKKENQLSTYEDIDFTELDDALLKLGEFKDDDLLTLEQAQTLQMLKDLRQALREGQKSAEQVQPEVPKEELAEAEPKVEEEDASGLEIGPENVPDPVGRGSIAAPSITKAFIGTNTISGGNLHRGKINGKNARGTVHVTLKDSSGNEKATVSVTPKSGTTWTVNLPAGATIAEGDTVTAYQEFDGQSSSVTTANAMESLAKQNKDKLKMPQGDIWIEQISSNLVNDDEQAEAVKMFNNANTEIAGDIKSVKFSIDGTDHAYYEVTYTDGSTSGKVEAPNLKIKQVTEYSRNAVLNDITIVDNVIKGKLEGEGPFAGIKVQLILKVSEAVKDSYCAKGKCLTDKDTSNPVDAEVNAETGEFSYTIPNPDLKLDQVIGVTVKEPHKFKSCSITTVKPVTVGKTEVRDPRKLTAEDKEAIDAAIRTAYTVDGESKLPNGTGDWKGVPAVIQIDDAGNAKIFSGNDVAGTWDPNNDYKFVPETNADGSYKVNDGAQPKITILAKDLVKNIAPKSPAILVDINTGEVTITPPAYENAGDDTDLASYTITYKDASGAEKTANATRTVNETSGKTTWTADNATVDANTGVITLKVEDIEVGGTVTATAKDNGGLEGDENPLESNPASETLETAEVNYDPNGGTGDMVGKKLNKGSKYTILPITFTPPSSHEFDTWEVDSEKQAPNAEIIVKKDTVIKAIWKAKPSQSQDPQAKYVLTFDPNGGNWEGETANKNFSVDKGDNFTIIPAPVKDGHKFLYWKGSEYKPGDKYLVEGNHTFVAQWEPSEIPYIVVPVHPTQTVVEPIGPVTQPTVQTTVTPTTPSPMVYTLPATGSVDASLTIWAGLGLALAGLLLKKRGQTSSQGDH